MAKARFHQHAFWVYGVIVGLAIKEALSAVLPHLLEYFRTPPASAFASISEAWKLLVFLIAIVRFYIGSGLYFTEYHSDEVVKSEVNNDGNNDAATTIKSTVASNASVEGGYVTDFLSGVLHFILFFAWSLSINLAPRPEQRFPFTVFEIVLGVVLLYDLVWWLVCRGARSKTQVRYWALANLATFVLVLVVHLLAFCVFRASIPLAEGLALIPVFGISIFDILGMAKASEVEEA
ncbi:MAG TPA: hypothetical protein VEK86_02120 [Gemmatimonadales bacterium]|nr:hypothetical protein [Gemmatimonadales bacterium]